MSIVGGRLRVASCVLILSLAACSNEDTAPPVAPIVEAVESPTESTTQLLTGTAEFGALVRVTGGASEVDVTADAYTARWFALVDLRLGDNALSVTATDAAGNQSEATVVTVTRVEPEPEPNPPIAELTGPMPGLILAPGGLLTVTVRVADDKGLAQVLLQATGADSFFRQHLVPVDTATGVPQVGPLDVSFQIDVRNGTFGDLVLVTQAVDTDGNITTSDPLTIQIDPTSRLTVNPGLTVSTVSVAGLLDNPVGIATDASRIYVANGGVGDAIVVAIDPAAPVLANQAVFMLRPFGQRGEDVAFFDDPNPNNPDSVFVSTTGGNDRIYRIDDTGMNQDTNWSVDVGEQPRGMVIDGPTTLAVIYEDSVVRRFDATVVTSENAPISTMDPGNVLRDAWGLELVQAGCPADGFLCATGQCIDNTQACNGVDNCGDGSDETPCMGTSFLCTNLTTVATTQICDGDDDCGDGSDELDCQRYAATDNGADDEVWAFYDDGDGNTTTAETLIGESTDEPRGIAVSPSGQFAYVASSRGSAILQLDLTLGAECVGGCPVVATGFDEVWGLVFDANGDLLVTDRSDQVVYRIQGLP